MPLVPYAGNPANFPAFIETLDDSVLRNASNLNAATEGLADRTAFLRGALAGTNGLNWQAPISAAGGEFRGAAWDANTALWLIASLATAGPTAIILSGSGMMPSTTWGPIGSGTTTLNANEIPTSLAADPDTVHFYMTTVLAGAAFQIWYTNGAGTYNGWGFTNNETDAKIVIFNNVVTVWAGCASSTHVGYYPSTNQMTTAPTLHTLAGSPTVTKWHARQNGSYALVSPGDAQASPFMMLSTDGTTWTKETGIALAVGATDAIVGLDWGFDSSGPCWVALVRRGTGTVVLRSSDGIAWSTGSTLTTALENLAFAGNIFFAEDTNGHLCFSPDGGVTWYQSQVTRTNPGGTATHGLAGSPTQVVSWETSVIRFALCAGLPAAPIP